MFLNVHDDRPSRMKEQVLHLFELHFLILGGLVCVCVSPRGKSRRLRGRLYAVNGFSEKNFFATV